MRKNWLEIIFLVVMWLSTIISYTIAIVQGYSLYITNYIGLAGLIIVTIVGLLKPTKLLVGLFLLLIYGLFHITSFLYIINGESYSKGVTYMPGSQFFTLILFILLIVARRKEIRDDLFRG